MGLLDGLFGGIGEGIGGLFSGLNGMFGSAFGGLSGMGGDGGSNLPLSIDTTKNQLPQMNFPSGGGGLLSHLFNPSVGQSTNQNMIPSQGLSPLTNPVGSAGFHPGRSQLLYPNTNSTQQNTFTPGAANGTISGVPQYAPPMNQSLNTNNSNSGGLLSKIANSVISPAQASEVPKGEDSNKFVNSQSGMNFYENGSTNNNFLDKTKTFMNNMQNKSAASDSSTFSEGGMSSLPTNKTDRIKAVFDSAKQVYGDTPQARIAAAQAVLESRLNGSPSKLAVNDNNLFGIKGKGTAGSANYKTAEYTKTGGKYYIHDNFAKNTTLEDSFNQHKNLMNRLPRYHGILQAQSVQDAASALGHSGYATDPQYGNQVLSTYNRYIKPLEGI